MSESPRVAVVGLGGLFPGAASPAKLWEAVLARRDAASEPPPGRWLLPLDSIYDPAVGKPDRVYSRRACFLAPFDVNLAGLGIDPDLVGRLDVVFRLALEAAGQAWRSAKTDALDRKRVGVILGAIALPTERVSALARHYLGRALYERAARPCPLLYDEVPHALDRHVTGMPAGVVAKALRLGGINYTLDAACASSLYAIKLAMDELTSGRADAMLAGGLSRPDSLYTQMGFAQLRALSPSGRCSPFDARADGLVVGEGAGVFVLKRLEDARRDGDRVLGVIRAVGLSNDIGGGLLAPASEGQLRAMRSAYEQAGWRPQDVGLIECHATGTPVGDSVEFASLKTLWGGDPSRRSVIGSAKSNVGHLLTGAGAAALTKVLFALNEGVLPPTANHEEAAPGLGMERSPFRVLRQAEKWEGPRRAAVSAFGFGGINAHLLVEGDEGRAAGVSPLSASLPARGEALSGLTPAARPNESPLAVVALAARVAPGLDADGLRRVLLGAPVPEAGGRFTTAVAAGRFRIPPREVEEMLPQQALLLAVAADALDAVALSEADRARTGAFVGVSLDLNTTNFHLRWALLKHAPDLADQGGPPLSANRVMGALASIAASRVAREFRLGGPSFTLSSGDASGLCALRAAAEALRRGELDAALVGAVDLADDERERAAEKRGEGAVVVVLKRLADAERDGDTIHAVVRGIETGAGGVREFWPERVGHLGAAYGMLDLVQIALRLREQIDGASPWLRDRVDGPRFAYAHAAASAGGVVVEVAEPPSVAFPPGPRDVPAAETLYAVEGSDVAALLRGLAELRSHGRPRRGTTGDAGPAVCLVAREGELPRLVDAAEAHLRRAPDESLVGEGQRVFYSPGPLKGTLAFVYPGSGNDFHGMGREVGLRWPALIARQDAENERLYSQYMPELFWGEQPGRPAVRDRIMAQVAVGTLVTDLLLSLGVRPGAAIGYSLGESSMLFGLRAWRDRDGMLRAMDTSPLFATELCGRSDAARKAWGLRAGEAVDWRTAIVERSPDEVREALAGLDRAYLQIINTPRECVVGGDRAQVAELGRRLACVLVSVPETTTMHCPVVKFVAQAYRSMHRWPTTPPAGVAFYSAGWGRAFEVTPDSAADALLAQARDTIDFPRVIEKAYADGVRMFVEMGPGASCSRMIAATLGDRPHLARSALVGEGIGSVLRVAAHLVASRVSIDLDMLQRAGSASPLTPRPPLPQLGEGGQEPVGNALRGVPGAAALPVTWPEAAPARADALSGQLAQTAAAMGAGGEAHAAYFRLAESIGRSFATIVEFQGQLFERVLGGSPLTPQPPLFQSLVAPAGAPFSALVAPAGAPFSALVAPAGAPAHEGGGGKAEDRLLRARLAEAGRGEQAVFLDRDQCLAFAVGKVGDVLGPDFAPIDAFPTRVRLPDEPLMLVDRIVSVEGEALSMTHGRVVTEHDILPDAWYLDAGRIPTCIAIESGQADLFLSGWLGIDFRTGGLAMYRLLDAAATFHRPLPGPGATIRYDIHIDHFFRQGETYLFRFRFVGTVDGEVLLTMSEGIAGFFTAADLAAGKGVVQTALQTRPRPGVRPDDGDILPAVGVESYDEARVDALRRGDLAGCFGPLFAGLPLGEPMRLPGGRMRLVHRVVHLDPDGGRYGTGLIRAEADVRPDDWFLTCHFVDDQVMPGTLMYECCLHTLRIFLMRLGWVGEHDEVTAEPIPGVTSRLKCRGQVTASTRVVTYEVIVRERGYNPAPYAIVDALMYADGKPIVDITDMCVQFSGLTREKVAAVWRDRALPASGGCKPPESTAVSGAGRTQGVNTLRSPAKATALFDRHHILAFATGWPSDCFGERYRPFDGGRFFARLPAPPFSFLDRITELDAEPVMRAGGTVVAEYDVPPDAWYFASERAAVMPFAVLQEAALQACGWMAAYMGSALSSENDLHFRNLGGNAELLRAVTPDSGTLRTAVKTRSVSSSAGMIIQDYAFELSDRHGPVYRGTTNFGFFTPQALAQQKGVQDAKPYVATSEEKSRGEGFDYPTGAPFPDDTLRMLDRVEVFVPDGGPAGLGFLEATKQVRPGEWFFAAHFLGDPVWPGSLGLEAMLQLLKVVAARRWPASGFETNLGKHRWAYRGQVVPSNHEVRVQAAVTGIDEARREVTADGHLSVDGLVIYRMTDFRVRVLPQGTASVLIPTAQGRDVIACP